MKKTKRLHFRRCHLCSGISENDGAPVSQCAHCGKVMAPFYFFDDLKVNPLSDVETRDSQDQGAGERRPVRGFTAYW